MTQEKKPRNLEDQYSWEELGNLFADRIEGSRFIEEKVWRRNDFLKWFAIREKIGIRFDWKLVARCYIISKNLTKQHDHFTVIVGREGRGKSTLMIQMMAWITPDLELEAVLFDMPGYISKLQEISKNFKKNKRAGTYRSLGIDEGGISLFSRESLSLSNRLLAKTFMVQRFLTVNVQICIPHYWSLDRMIRDHRVETLIVIKERGYYKAFVGKGIKILNKLGAKDKDKSLIALPIPYGYFWDGSFHKSFPKTINDRKYEEYKFQHIKSFLQDAKMEANTVKMVKVGILEKEFGITRDSIIRQIHKGEIEGRKIGNQWFITKKAYDKLVMGGVY